MPFIILWIVLGFILAMSALLRQSWITGQTAFTGPWFVSLTALWAYPSSWKFISFDAAALIISAHTFFFISSFVASNVFWRREEVIPKTFIISEDYLLSLRQIFWPFIIIGLAGSWLTVASTGALGSYQENELIITRSLIITKDIHIPMYQRLMSNFLYPASLLGALCFVFSKGRRWSYAYLFLPIMGIIIYSFAMGGRGAILIGSNLIFWAFMITGKTNRPVESKKLNLVMVLIGLGLLIGWYFALIVSTRLGSSPALIFESLYQYLIGPVPSFSKWLAFHDLPLGKIDFSDISFVRELLHLGGIVKERDIGNHIAYIPFQFNIFTSLAEHLRDFGLTGAFIISALLGSLSAVLENKDLSAQMIGVRATFYAYLSFTLFADLAYLSVGWWLTLFTIILTGLYCTFFGKSTLQSVSQQV